jgi:hypothetical protein
MDDLVAFIAAALDEDARVAWAAGSRLQPEINRWVAGDGNNDGVRTGAGTPVTLHSWPNEMDHIARWDPARVLAEVAAKREILRRHQDNAGECATCAYERLDGSWDWPCPTARALAAPYRSAPGFRPEWATEVTE